MALLARLSVRGALEIGTFTGYSALGVARPCRPTGTSSPATSTRCTGDGERHWQEAGVADKIDLRLGPALATLDAMLAEGGEGRFDFAFIDADKDNYDNYYERCCGWCGRAG